LKLIYLQTVIAFCFKLIYNCSIPWILQLLCSLIWILPTHFQSTPQACAPLSSQVCTPYPADVLTPLLVGVRAPKQLCAPYPHRRACPPFSQACAAYPTNVRVLPRWHVRPPPRRRVRPPHPCARPLADVRALPTVVRTLPPPMRSPSSLVA
jgi:hypothetical protein